MKEKGMKMNVDVDLFLCTKAQDRNKIFIFLTPGVTRELKPRAVMSDVDSANLRVAQFKSPRHPFCHRKKAIWSDFPASLRTFIFAQENSLGVTHDSRMVIIVTVIVRLLIRQSMRPRLANVISSGTARAHAPRHDPSISIIDVDPGYILIISAAHCRSKTHERITRDLREVDSPVPEQTLPSFRLVWRSLEDHAHHTSQNPCARSELLHINPRDDLE